jgi:hypothetical protein
VLVLGLGPLGLGSWILVLGLGLGSWSCSWLVLVGWALGRSCLSGLRSRSLLVLGLGLGS